MLLQEVENLEKTRQALDVSIPNIQTLNIPFRLRVFSSCTYLRVCCSCPSRLALRVRQYVDVPPQPNAGLRSFILCASAACNSDIPPLSNKNLKMLSFIQIFDTAAPRIQYKVHQEILSKLKSTAIKSADSSNKENEIKSQLAETGKAGAQLGGQASINFSGLNKAQQAPGNPSLLAS